MAVRRREAPKAGGVNPNPNASTKVWLFSLLLTLQYGAQPLISKRCTSKFSACALRDVQGLPYNTYLKGLKWNFYFSGNADSAHAANHMHDVDIPFFVHYSLLGSSARPIREVIVTSCVLACEVVKISAIMLLAKDGSLRNTFKKWTLIGSLTASGLPAAIYALQNSLLQISYRNLDSLTFSMLNQTKLFFTALFTFIILRQKQSIQQIGALFLLIIAAILLSIGEGSSKASSSQNPDEILFYGIIPVLVASVLSGLASALCQWASQVKKHASYLMTVEMSIIGSLCLVASAYKSPDGSAIRQHGFFYGWTPLTWIPVVLNAVGGILVGLVTSYAGGVRKGFVIVSALLVTALLQFIFDGKPPSPYCLVALPLVVTSISIYQKYPYHVKKKEL
ncbi:UDP-N-acetylglucosamine transporter ROCK1 [Sesamum angolense]|uniref:UDP-N-acetylglucosamine transporter ROCK1 n=1 Tax=Sesamum angolense TaxID=2727404 RepID=A0AAE1XGV2_9LAMI|nr:UDP-N-acetylglucosamine transporter ROCK1 [Sesamum angolense]